jgi:hypothetical protein
LVEGEKAADAAAVIMPGFVASTWPGGSSAAGMADWSALKGREVWIWPDHDEPGRRAAEAVGDALLELAAGVRIVDLPPDLPEGWDLADQAPDGLDLRELINHAERHVDRLERLVEQAETDPGAPFENEAVDFLAALRGRDKAAYERARARLKKAQVRIGELDQEVERRKPEVGADDAGKGRVLELPEPEPWAEPVESAELIADLVDQIRRFMILSDHAALGAALWVIHAHAHDAAFHSPRLTLTSPTNEHRISRASGELVEPVERSRCGRVPPVPAKLAVPAAPAPRKNLLPLAGRIEPRDMEQPLPAGASVGPDRARLAVRRMRERGLGSAIGNRHDRPPVLGLFRLCARRGRVVGAVDFAEQPALLQLRLHVRLAAPGVAPPE